MKKYKLFSDESKEIISQFLYYTNNITKYEINNILNYFQSRITKNKFYLITNNDFTVIALIDQYRQTTYIYSNCGINFDLSSFFKYLLKYKKLFSAILCNELLYNRFKLFLSPNNILLEKKENLYLLDLCDFYNFNNKSIDTIISTYDIPNYIISYLLYNQFYMLLNDHQIVFIYQNHVGIINVDNTESFTETFFDIKEENFKLILNKNEDFIEGCIVVSNNQSEIKQYIKSFVLIKCQYEEYQIKCALSLYTDISLYNEIKVLLNVLKIYNGYLFFYNKKEINTVYFNQLGFNIDHTNIYIYYYNYNNHIIKEIPELREKIFVENNMLAIILFLFLLCLYMNMPYFLFRYLDYFNNLIYRFTFSIIYFLLGIPLTLFKPRKVYFKSELIQSYYFIYDYISTIFIIIFFINLIILFFI